MAVAEARLTGEVFDQSETLTQRQLLARIFFREGFDYTDPENSDGSDSDAEDLECWWTWSKHDMSPSVSLATLDREVYFHPDYSCGTAAVRGNQVLDQDGQHYWEIKMTSAVYGTDMMVGVGSTEVDLSRYRSHFCSLIGKDSESWGLSYFGTIHHNGKVYDYTSKFERGTVIGVHLDLWHGCLSFYKNHEPLGIAFEGLQGKKLYPMVSSTAARTKMKLQCSLSTKSSLQFLCSTAIAKTLPGPEAIKDLPLPPGIKRYIVNNMDWVFIINNCSLPKPTSAKKLRRK